jgi:hypothetical protein
MSVVPTAWLTAAAGAIGGLVGIASVVAALFEVLPLAFVLLAIGLIWIQRLGSTASASDRSRVRLAWKAAAWLFLAGGLAVPLRNVPGETVTVALIVGCALLGVLANAAGDRIVPA